MDDKKNKLEEQSEKDKNKGTKSEDLELLQQKTEELENQNKRILADYRNLEKRTDSQRRDWILKANKKLLLNLLPVLDTLMLGEKHSKDDQSLGLSIKQFLDILKSEGVEAIKTQGANFDPNLMECIQTVEGEDGKVVDEVRPGYTLYEKILRPAQVAVGKGLMSS